ncbi:MAG: GrpB family protein [Deltaproteobacteria bacterium]
MEVDEPMHLEHYDAAWASWFAADAEELKATLGQRLRALEHFGSTAVPGTLAKPVVDILVVPTDNLAVVSWQGTHWRNNLAIRDFLRANPHVAAGCGAVKRQAWAGGATALLAYSQATSSLGTVLSSVRGMTWPSCGTFGLHRARVGEGSRPHHSVPLKPGRRARARVGSRSRPKTSTCVRACVRPARARPEPSCSQVNGVVIDLFAVMLPFHAWAARPPLGWNSWDCFATTVREEQVKEQADYMASALAQHGWRYVVVDIQWYEPGATGFLYRAGAELTLDAWGRLLPAPERFPSSRDGAGFKPLADYVHGLGLAFGLHLMRGIPRLAVTRNLPIFGSRARAAEIARIEDTCAWNPDMFGIDMSRPGAQEYYDSVFALLSAWGVDYVKVDDISRPYHAREAEIEAIRCAIDRCGRPMVLSLSPGATPLSAAEHVKRHANLWRISDDFWDNWDLVYEQFPRLAAWIAQADPGHWPDADMLPFGVLDLGRRSSRLSRDEQLTVMTLWCIARSPLMYGGDLTRMDERTLSLLSNPEVLAVNQASDSNQLLFDRDGLVAWSARPEGTRERYVALFNTRDRQPIDPGAACFSALLRGGARAQRHPIDVAVVPGARLRLVADDGSGGSGHQHAIVWAEVLLSGPSGKLRLGDLPWVKASTRWGDVSRDRGPDGRALQLAGQDIAHGFGVHTKSSLEFEVPEGYTRLTGACGFAGAAAPPRDEVPSRCLVFVLPREPEDPSAGLAVTVTARELGLEGPIRVRDLWRRDDLGSFQMGFEALVPWHGARLFRVQS